MTLSFIDFQFKSKLVLYHCWYNRKLLTCVFESSAGPDSYGEKFTGQEQVKKAFENVFATFPDAHWSSPRHFILRNTGFSEWIFTGTKSDGTKIEVTGCDLFTFKDAKIAIKNSYRKNRLTAK